MEKPYLKNITIDWFRGINYNSNLVDLAKETFTRSFASALLTLMDCLER